jgi:hypothetical protein
MVTHECELSFPRHYALVPLAPTGVTGAEHDENTD